jgi:hypothetical protein
MVSVGFLINKEVDLTFWSKNRLRRILEQGTAPLLSQLNEYSKPTLIVGSKPTVLSRNSIKGRMHFFNVMPIPPQEQDLKNGHSHHPSLHS